MKLVSELELPGVIQVSIAKKNDVSTSIAGVTSRLSKKDLVRDFKSGGNRSQK